MTWADIEHLRDETYHRTPRLQVRSVEQAYQFINTVGFCFAFKAQNSELPCLWHAAAGEREPAYPRHVQHDLFIGLVWQTKDELPAAKKVYYGKALKKRPTLISLDVFPDFYKIRRPEPDDSYLVAYMRGELSTPAKRIMDALQDHSPQITADLKISSGLAHPDHRAVFDKAMAELQMQLQVVKIGEFYDPFTFLWELVERWFADEICIAQTRDIDESRRRILDCYFKNRIVSDARAATRLLRWQPQDILAAIQNLEARGQLFPFDIDDEKQPVWAHEKHRKVLI